ncbi:MAG: hypothetical protein ACI8PT_004557, partial [Gammaproteobacteria bacterium]
MQLSARKTLLVLGLLASTGASLGLSLAAAAQSPEEKGLAIAVEADKRDTGWTDRKADMTMVLRNKQGQQSTRVLRSR